jgi:NADPH:quinone reductase-like Zn-dependent oxidoreductase
MKGFVYERYGPPERLRMVEVATPAPEVGEVLVRVLATSVNAADWHSMRGKPRFSRATLGLRRPRVQPHSPRPTRPGSTWSRLSRSL